MRMSSIKDYLIGVLVVAALCALGIAQEKINITGDWEMTTSTPQGDMTADLKIVQTGDKLAVTLSSQFGEISGEGKITGADVEWTLSMDSPNGKLTILHKGKVEGDTMSGEAQMGDFGTMTWKAKKKSV
jgi:hypothetical protein